jgi:hypothetical protein
MVSTGFMRRQNPEAAADVICLNCCRTVARSQAHADLLAAENDHSCNPFDDLVFPIRKRSRPARNMNKAPCQARLVMQTENSFRVHLLRPNEHKSDKTARQRILLVDDDEVVREMLRERGA